MYPTIEDKPLEQDGHRWMNPSVRGDRCVYCAIRIEKYGEILTGIKNNPDSIEHVALAVCDRLLATVIDVDCPTCGKHYHYDITGRTCKQIHCDCNTDFLGVP